MSCCKHIKMRSHTKHLVTLGGNCDPDANSSLRPSLFNLFPAADSCKVSYGHDQHAAVDHFRICRAFDVSVVEILLKVKQAIYGVFFPIHLVVLRVRRLKTADSVCV